MNSYGFSTKKSQIFRRRSSRISRRRIGHHDGRYSDRASTDVVYKIVKMVDPTLKKTIRIQEEEAHKQEA